MEITDAPFMRPSSYRHGLHPFVHPLGVRRGALVFRRLPIVFRTRIAAKRQRSAHCRKRRDLEAKRQSQVLGILLSCGPVRQRRLHEAIVPCGDAHVVLRRDVQRFRRRRLRQAIVHALRSGQRRRGALVASPVSQVLVTVGPRKSNLRRIITRVRISIISRMRVSIIMRMRKNCVRSIV
eukprot:scaffold3178_cov282-Pinguiococcus_pyrenoidosus.AAC.9